MSHSGVPSSLICIGFINKVHGLKGVVKVRLFNPLSDALEQTRQVFLVGTTQGNEVPRAYNVVHLQHAELGFCLVGLQDISSREQAEELLQKQIFVDKQKLSPLKKNEIYVSDLVGFRVFFHDDCIGQVSRILFIGGQDLLEVLSPSGKEILIPMVADIVSSIQKETQSIFIDPPEGLLDLNQ